MNLWFRMIFFLFTWRLRKRIDFFEESKTPFRTWPTDLDFNIHMNNGIYLSLMDIARFDLSFRNGLGHLLKKRKWFPVVASQTIRYKKSLKPFQKFKIHTQLIGWDEKFFYIRQKFVAKKRTMAMAIVKAAIIQKEKRGVIPPLSIVEEAGHRTDENHLPPWIHQWTESERAHWEELDQI